ncbi:MAG: transposase [Kosmotogaceae bacterium]|nr:transposase [Kosmotogaceae bacterium]
MRSKTILPGTRRLSRFLEISPEAKRRLKWFDWYRSHGGNTRLTCRHFGISPDTFYRWKRRYQPYFPKTLESYSRRPHHYRQSRIPKETVDLVTKLRKEEMGLSKYKLSQILVRDYGIRLSPSSVNRILLSKGLIKEANVSRDIRRRKRINYVIPRVRASKQLRYKQPGWLVQLDTKHLTVLGRRFYQFTAVDCYSRLSFSQAYTTISSSCAKDFLNRLTLYFPFRIKAIQTDNGSEYLLYFHKECLRRKITHYFSHPHTPKDNALAERMIQTTVYELWLFDETLIPELGYLNQKLSVWVGRYNTYRPHQALNYLTPMAYYQQYLKKGEKVSGM